MGVQAAEGRAEGGGTTTGGQASADALFSVLFPFSPFRLRKPLINMYF